MRDVTSLRGLRLSFLLLLLISLTACSLPQQTALPEAQVNVSTPTPLSVPTAAPTATADPNATAEPYAELSIASLAARSYGGGQVVDLGLLGNAPSFTRHMMSFPSDGLTINGFIDIPEGEGPFPVVLVLHGYVDPMGYQVENYTARYSATFAHAGYIAIHPNYRNYAPSDSGPNEFRVGYAIDVLNLIADVNAQAGQAGLLEKANADAVFLWGHSMGGGIALRVITVGADVQGALVYGAMSGDERRNFVHIRDVLSDGERGNEELTVPEDALLSISPLYFYDRIQVPVSIHHGDLDDQVPAAWSRELCALLVSLAKSADCFEYSGMGHIFTGPNDDLLIQRSLEFFQRYTPGQ